MSPSIALHPHSHGPSYHSGDKELQLYASNELLFYVEHDRGGSIRPPLNSKWLDTILRSGDCSYQLPDEVATSLDEEIPGISFPGSLTRGRFTIFCVRSPVLNAIQEMMQFYEMDPRYQGIRFNGGIIRWVLPNWFNGAAYHVGIGPHGPGGPPCPVEDVDIINRLAFTFTNRKPNNDPGLRAPRASTPGKVAVYILDTIPNKCRIKNALSTWPLLKKHYEKILAHQPGKAAANPHIYETEKATYHFAGGIGQDFSPTYFSVDHPYAVGNHEYDSSDHGLFIAGIVHMIAPEAQIHVIEVMNEFGVGTFLNFANGFHKMLSIHKELNPKSEKKLGSMCHAIVNCSFTLSIPIDGHETSADKGLLECIKRHPNLFNQQLEGLSDALTDSLATGAIVVGAAGNDSTAQQPRKKARYPAKYKQVVGIGALKRDGNPADYSNEDDDPDWDGVYTFGGNYARGAASKSSTEGKKCGDGEEGLISIFTGNLNIEIDGTPTAYPPEFFINPSGYAEWSGTSFATPVLAGTLAQVSSLRNKSPKKVYEDDLKKFIRANRHFDDVRQQR
jgi:hypothetical protein